MSKNLDTRRSAFKRTDEGSCSAPIEHTRSAGEGDPINSEAPTPLLRTRSGIRPGLGCSRAPVAEDSQIFKIGYQIPCLSNGLRSLVANGYWLAGVVCVYRVREH